MPVPHPSQSAAAAEIGLVQVDENNHELVTWSGHGEVIRLHENRFVTTPEVVSILLDTARSRALTDRLAEIRRLLG